MSPETKRKQQFSDETSEKIRDFLTEKGQFNTKTDKFGDMNICWLVFFPEGAGLLGDIRIGIYPNWQIALWHVEEIRRMKPIIDGEVVGGAVE